MPCPPGVDWGVRRSVRERARCRCRKPAGLRGQSPTRGRSSARRELRSCRSWVRTWATGAMSSRDARSGIGGPLFRVDSEALGPARTGCRSSARPCPGMRLPRCALQGRRLTGADSSCRRTGPVAQVVSGRSMRSTSGSGSSMSRISTGSSSSDGYRRTEHLRTDDLTVRSGRSDRDPPVRRCPPIRRC